VTGVLIGFGIIAFVIVVGYIAGRLGVGGPSAGFVLNRVAFFVTNPALLFVTLARADLRVVFSTQLLVAAAAALVSAGLFLALSRAFFRQPAPETTIGALGAGYVNANNIGLPVSLYVLGDASSSAPVILLQLIVLAPIALTVLDVTTSGHVSVGRILLQPVRNPLIIGSLLGVIVAVGALALFLPRVRDAQAGPWRPSLPRVPAGLRRAFVAGALAVSAAYAVGSVFLALCAQVAADLLRSSNALLNGTVIAISAIAIGGVAVLTRRVPPRVALGIGPAAILFGMGSLVLAGIAHSMPLFVVSSVFTGGGYSLMYAGGLGIITATAQVHHRAAVISAAFTVGYLVQAVVALVLGAIATDTGLLVAIELAAVIVMALAVAAALVANVRAGRRSPTAPVPRVMTSVR